MAGAGRDGGVSGRKECLSKTNFPLGHQWEEVDDPRF